MHSPEGDILVERVVQILAANHPLRTSYKHVRARLMSFCLDEWIPFEHFHAIAVHLAERSNFGFSKNWKLFMDDTSLRCLIHGSMAFHSQPCSL